MNANSRRATSADELRPGRESLARHHRRLEPSVVEQDPPRGSSFGLAHDELRHADGPRHTDREPNRHEFDRFGARRISVALRVSPAERRGKIAPDRDVHLVALTAKAQVDRGFHDRASRIEPLGLEISSGLFDKPV